MTLTELINDAKSIIGVSCEVSDETLKSWVNEAQDYIVSEILNTIPDYFTQGSCTSSVANQQEYMLPNDFQSMIDLKVNGVTYSKLGKFTANSQIPNTYYLNGNVFGLYPIPTTNEVKNIQLIYQYSVPELEADSDTSVLPIQFQRLLKHYVLSNYQSKDDEETNSLNRLNSFQSRLDKLIEKLSQRGDFCQQLVEEVE